MKLFSIATVLGLGALSKANPVADKRHGHHCPTPPPDHAGNTSVSTAPDFTFDALWKLQVNFFDQYMYPNNVKQVEAINSTLFSDNVKGRVDVTRTFDGAELNTEYIFGLFAEVALNPTKFTLLGSPVDYHIVHFAASQNIASASTIIDYVVPAFNVSVPVEVDTWLMFDASGKIEQYDVTFRWFEYLLDSLTVAAMPKLNVTTVEETVAIFTKLIASGICDTHAQYCNGTNTQFDSYASCLTFLTQDIRFGQAYEFGANTLSCRMVHETMIPFRPDVHCPHIGRSGGGMCVDDYTYAKKVLQPYFTNSPFVPYGYQDKNATIAAM